MTEENAGFPPLTAADRIPDWTAAERERIEKLDPVVDLKELSQRRPALPLIAELINKVVAARANAQSLGADVAELRETWESEHAEKLAALKSAKKRREAAEVALRLEALALYEKRGAVTNAPGVGVKLRWVAQYAHDAAIAWAIKQDEQQFLALNTRLFAKHAIAVADTAPLKFVTIMQVPFATLAKYLSPWVAAKPEADEGA